MTASTTTAEAEVVAEKPKAKRVLRPIIVPGKIVRVEKPVHPIYSYSEQRTKPGDIVIVDSVTEDGVINVIDIFLSPQKMVKKGTKLTIVTKPDQSDFLEKARKSVFDVPIHRVKYLTGFDPEVFAVDEKGLVIPAFKYLPPKENPLRIPCSNGNTGDNLVFWDGFQAEFATENPGHCHAYSVDQIRLSMQAIFNESRKFNPKAILTHKCVLDIPFEMMQECSPEQYGLGCSPSKNVYGETKHLESLNPSELPFRFAGCHIHYNTLATPNADNELMVKMLDAIAGVCSVAILAGMEDDRRRKFYGLAGEYRLPKHGLEYRVLSSALLAHPILMIFFLDFTRQIVGDAKRLSFVWQGSEAETKEVINNLDVEQSKKIIKRNNSLIKKMIKGAYTASRVDKVFGLFDKGAMNVLPIGDMEKNWKFNKSWTDHVGDPDTCIARWGINNY